MNIVQEKIKELPSTTQLVAKRLLEDIVISIPICYAHINPEDVDKYDDVGNIVFSKLVSDATVLACIIGYKNHKEILDELLNY